MFDLFRSREKSVRILLGALLVLVAASMLVYLIPGGPGGPSAAGQNVVAAVGDEKITAQDVQRAVQTITRGQTNLPKGILAMYLPSLVNQLIEQKAMAYRAREMGIAVSDQELGDAIQAELTAQMGGKFDMQIYQAVLAQQGLTPADYEHERREALLGMRLENIEARSVIISDQEAKAEYQRKNLKVGLQYIAFASKDFESKVSKDPAAIKAYFEKHRADFRIPEKRDVSLVVGTSSDFMQGIQISDQQLQREYQEAIDSYRTPERVRVRHILIKTQGKPKEEAPKLKAKAEDILKQLKNKGDFAELAKKNSEDPGSAVKGGELGWIVRGQTVPNFEKAAFSLKPNQMSDVIETEYGYHILQVEEKQEAHTQSFDEVKPQLLAEAKKQAAMEAVKKAVDAARNEIQKTPSQAEAIAKKNNLKFVKVDKLASGGQLPDFNQPELSNAVFATAKSGMTDVVEAENQGKAGFAMVTNIYPARNAEYAEVQNDVQQKYVTAESTKLAEDAAKAAAEQARKGQSLEAIAKKYGGKVKEAAPFTIDGAAEGIGSASLLPGAFKGGKVGDIIGPVSAQSSEFVCRISQVIPADMSQYAKNKDGVVQSLTQQREAVAQPLFRDSVVNDLKRRGKIKINQETLNRIVSSYQQG